MDEEQTTPPKDAPQRIMELYGPWRSAEQKNMLKALAQLQGQMKPAPKSSKAHQYIYADLVSVMETCMPLMTSLGLSVQQFQRQLPNGSWQLETTVWHESGEYIRGMTPILPASAKIQDFGGAITYARRYGLMSAIGMTSDEEDTDGHAPTDARKPPAKKVTASVQAKPVSPPPQAPPTSKNGPSVDKVAQSFEAVGVTRQDLCDYFGRELTQLSAEEAEELRGVRTGLVSGATTWDDALAVRRARRPPPVAAEAIRRAAEKR